MPLKTIAVAALALPLLLLLLTGQGPVSAQTTTGEDKGRKMRRTNFTSENEKMVGNLFLPKNYQAGRKLPAVLIVGPWLNVKEQVATNYAVRLADKGFAAFVFDFRHWGESGGEPREYESPKDKIADIHAALRSLAERPEIDKERVGVLAVCFGVGYVAAAADDPRIKSVATVAAWVHDVPTMERRR
jgi:uncharacterized protein